MQLHANAKLGPSGRYALVRAIEDGLSLKAAVAAFSVSPATAHRCWHRYLESEPHSPAALADRSSRPRRSPWQLSLAEDEWSRPGALLHVDVRRLVRFEQPGHRVTGDRRRRSRAAGFEYVHCVIDDHSRYAHVELHSGEDAETAARVLERALGELAELGLDPTEAVMTDNAFVYTRGARFQALLARRGVRHIVTPPYTPRWNGKVERFIQTLLREWAYVRTRESSRARARALLSFVRFYNRRRPHASLGGRPPLSRVHNVLGSDS